MPVNFSRFFPKAPPRIGRMERSVVKGAMEAILADAFKGQCPLGSVNAVTDEDLIDPPEETYRRIVHAIAESATALDARVNNGHDDEAADDKPAHTHSQPR